MLMNTALKSDSYCEENRVAIKEKTDKISRNELLLTHSQNKGSFVLQRRKTMKRFSKKLGETFKSKLSIAYIIFSALYLAVGMLGYVKIHCGLILCGALILGNIACTFSSMYAEDKSSMNIN